MSVAWSSACPSSTRRRTPASVWNGTARGGAAHGDAETGEERFTGNGELQRCCLSRLEVIGGCSRGCISRAMRLGERDRPCAEAVDSVHRHRSVTRVGRVGGAGCRPLCASVGSVRMAALTRLTACRTVVWLRPPMPRPISGRLCSVSSRARYIATWRAAATAGRRSRASSAVALDPELLRRGVEDLRRCRRRPGAVSSPSRRRTCRTSAGVAGSPLSEA